MKALKVYNSENETISVVVGNWDLIIKPKSFVMVETDASFNTDDFHVMSEENWQPKFNTKNGDLELYISKPIWIDESYKMYGKTMATK